MHLRAKVSLSRGKHEQQVSHVIAELSLALPVVSRAIQTKVYKFSLLSFILTGSTAIYSFAVKNKASTAIQSRTAAPRTPGAVAPRLDALHWAPSSV